MYRDITTQAGSMTIEDWNHWIQFFSEYVLLEPARPGVPLLSPELRELFKLLQNICRHYLHYSIVGDDPLAAGNPYSPESRQKARDNLRHYASLVELVRNLLFPSSFANMHPCYPCWVSPHEQYCNNAHAYEVKQSLQMNLGLEMTSLLLLLPSDIPVLPVYDF